MTRAESVRAQLERILGNPLFSAADRHTRLLRFLVEETLSGSGASLKESLLAVEVFGRTGDHDPKIDSLVRVEMGRLRSRLIEYYAQSGRDDPVRIEIPKGPYEPVFVFRDEVVAEDPNTASTLSATVRPRWRIATYTAATAVIALAFALWLWKRTPRAEASRPA